AFQTQIFNFIGQALCPAVFRRNPFKHLDPLAQFLDFALQFLLALSALLGTIRQAIVTVGAMSGSAAMPAAEAAKDDGGDRDEGYGGPEAHYTARPSPLCPERSPTGSASISGSARTSEIDREKEATLFILSRSCPRSGRPARAGPRSGAIRRSPCRSE